MTEEELAAMEAGMRGETAQPWHDPLHVAYLSDVPRLIAEVRRLRGLLVPLVQRVPTAHSDVDDPYCAYCDGSLYPEPRHAAACPWARARDGV